MADYNEVIKNLQTVHGMPMTIRLAIEASEKQIPKKPAKQWGDNVCPNCRTDTRCRVLMGREERCPACGQAIDWGADEET